MIISVVIPVYNEEKIIADTMTAVKNFMDKNFISSEKNIDYEAIFVNDGSRDNTLRIAESLATGSSRIKVITYGENKGKGGAVRTGVLKASGDIIFFTDCDLAYGLDVLVEACDFFAKNNNADMLIGSRKLHKNGYASYSFLRKIASTAFMKVLRIYGGVKLSDSQTGFKGFRKDACRKIFSMCEINGFAFDFEILLTAQNMNMKILEMPIKIINHRDSKVNLIKDSLKMFKDVAHIKKLVREKFHGK